MPSTGDEAARGEDSPPLMIDSEEEEQPDDDGLHDYNADVLRSILNQPQLLQHHTHYSSVSAGGGQQELPLMPRRDDSDRWIPRPTAADTETARNNTVRICLASAIEMLCNVMVDRSKARQRQAFIVLSEMLVKNGLLPATFVSDEFSSLRHQYAGAIERLLNHCANKLADGGSATTMATASSAQLIALRGRLESTATLRPAATTSQTSAIAAAARFELPDSSVDYSLDDNDDEDDDDSETSTSRPFSHDYFPSRFKREFSECSVIGNGGFGQVLKAVHSVDRCEYALKKIPFDYAQSSLCFRVLREIQMLARLHHPNIVRYYGAWFELESTDKPCNAAACPHKQTRATYQNGLNEAAAAVELEDASLRLASVATPSIQFESSNNQPDQSELDSSSSQPANGLLSKHSTNAGSNERLALVGHHEQQSPGGLHHDHYCWPPHMPLVNQFVVYIQMQLGTSTLQEYIKQRNTSATPFDQLDMFSCVNAQFNERVLFELLSAVQYVHGNGLIHRDIKPGNIFLAGPAHEHVLLGDFGLACYDDSQDAQRQLHSSGLGTMTYAAPEQLTTTSYTSKVDVFSVGIVAFELYRPFSTNMEKTQTIQALRRGAVDDRLLARFPLEASIIERCVELKPAKRPSAAELIHSNWFSASNQLLESLKSTVDAQQSKIDQLCDLLRKHHIPFPDNFDS